MPDYRNDGQPLYCPSCGEAMRQIITRRQTTVYDICFDCGLRWLRPENLDSIKNNDRKSVGKLAGIAKKEAKRRKTALPAIQYPELCPSCSTGRLRNWRDDDTDVRMNRCEECGCMLLTEECFRKLLDVVHSWHDDSLMDRIKKWFTGGSK